VRKSPLTEDTRRNRRIVAAAAITALGGLLFGYDTGVVSGALLFLKTDFGGLSNLQQELVTSLLLVGAMAGAILAGRISDKIGRKSPCPARRWSSSSASCWPR
jgi:MFS family permease